MVQVSQYQDCVKPMKLGSVQAVLTSKLHIVPLPDGSLHMKDAMEQESSQLPKDVSVNLVVLSLSTLHELYQGVADNLKV